MQGSLTVAKFYGIPVRLHYSFLLLVGGLAAWWWYQRGWAAALGVVGVLLLLFASVLLHELGHSRQAAKYGIKTRHITLLPIGGVASLERIPERPSQEAKVAIAGPLVNLLLAGLAAPFVVSLGGPLDLARPTFAPPGETSVPLYFYWINVFMFLFNLLPAFPMDGGRILRAGLAARMDYARATSIASDVGRAFSFVFVLVGFFVNLLLIVVGIFIYLGASGEERFVAVAALLRKRRVRDAMDERFLAVRPEATLSAVVRGTFENRQSDFPVVEPAADPSAPAPPPVLTAAQAEGAPLVGVLDRQDILKAIQRQGGGDGEARAVMRSEFPRVHADDRLSVAYRLFQERGVRMLPVVAPRAGGGERVIGILAVEDLERAYAALANRERALGDAQKAVAQAVPGFARANRPRWGSGDGEPAPGGEPEGPKPPDMGRGDGRAERPGERGDDDEDQRAAKRRRDWRRDYI